MSAILEADLQSDGFKQNPFPELERLRQVGPLFRTRVPFIGQIWMATTYEAVTELLRDHRRFVQNPATAGNRFVARLIRWLPRGLRPVASHMLLKDEPDHRRLRNLVNQAFQRQSIEGMRGRLTDLVDTAIDRMAAVPQVAVRGVDLVEHFAQPFPLAVICELLGLPDKDRPRFTRWASGVTSSRSVWGTAWGLLRLRKLVRYLQAQFREQARNPRPGLVAALIEAEEAGDRLTEDELVAMVFLLLLAGHLTTVHLIAGGVLTLLDHPGQKAELLADWSLADSAVNELLRFCSFVLVTKPRYAIEDTEFFGQRIRRGEILIACLASANSDPERFDRPEEFDIHRRPNPHVAFGTGIHVCLGETLARAEAGIALRQLFTRFPHLDLAVPRGEVEYTPRYGMRGLARLPVRLQE